MDQALTTLICLICVYVFLCMCVREREAMRLNLSLTKGHPAGGFYSSAKGGGHTSLSKTAMISTAIFSIIGKKQKAVESDPDRS